MKGPTGNTTQKRLRILRDDEIDALYGRPRFTPEEREEYFALPAAQSATLQLGYFKARHMFVVLNPDKIAEDAKA